MIKLQDFVNKYNGKYVDWDKNFGPQCVDLMRFYLDEVVGISGLAIPPAPYAKNMFQRFPTLGDANFTKIVNTKNNVPNKGDIIFWGTYPWITGVAGHVAIYCDGNVNKFISFDQNYGPPNFCKYVNHNYKGVMGWLRSRRKIV